MNLIVSSALIVLVISCLTSVYRAEDEHNKNEERKLNRLGSIKLATKSLPKISRIQINDAKVGNKRVVKPLKGLKKFSKFPTFQTALELSKNTELRDRPRKHSKKLNRAMMALLMAYKLKFAALIPTMIGGLILLMSTTALAGFFFALFAAILGLRGQ